MGETLTVPEGAPPTETNKHVREYLSYYVSLPHSPQYAVMINGPWGIGKTFLIKEFLRRNVGNTLKHIYVSLYGLTTIDEINDALLQALYPVLNWRVSKIGARIGKTVLKHFGFESDLTSADVLTISADLLVFDDLERCEASINKVLGYTNAFVEHDGCKVIIIANENEITQFVEYQKRREKLIGKTLEVQSSFDEALLHFLSLIDDADTKSLFQKNLVEICAIYKQSGLNNLRILQQTMWDFERFSHALTDVHRQNKEAMTILLQLLFALSFELKAGRINPGDLRSRMNRLTEALVRDKGEKPSPLMTASQLYPEIDLDDSIISDEVLGDILVNGIIDEVAIRSCIDASRYFVIVAAEPAWRTVWHWFERTEDEFAVALNKMEQQFAAREFSLPGEILHVLGLRLFLSCIDLLKKSRAEVISEGKSYIDDLYATKRLAPLSASDEFSEVRFGGYGGLGIQDNDTAEYQELFAYLQQKRKQVSEESYPEQGLALLKEMESDPHLFFQRVCLTNSTDNWYYHIPILASIDPSAFVSSMLKSSPAHQRTIMMALRTRYEHGGLQGELAAEKAWLIVVRDKLWEHAWGLPPIGKYRLVANIKSNINPALVT
jgi:KAP family P-loop domain